MNPIDVRTISAADHLGFLRSRASASFLQTPAWGAVKQEWVSESIGWFRGDELVGAGLVLYRQLPKVKKYLAYLPEGPVIDWSDTDLSAWLDPMTVSRIISCSSVLVGEVCQVTRSWLEELTLPIQAKSRRSAWKLGLSPKA